MKSKDGILKVLKIGAKFDLVTPDTLKPLIKPHIMEEVCLKGSTQLEKC